MDHLQFEAMLLDPPLAASKEQAALKAHLASCSVCRDLALALDPLENHLRKASLVMPVDGFTNRFQSRLATKRRKAQERILVLAVLGIAAGLVGLAFLFGGELVSGIAPLVTAGLKSIGHVLRIGSMVGLLGEFLSVLIEGVVGNVSPAYLLAASLASSGLVSLWVFSLYRFNYQPIRRE